MAAKVGLFVLALACLSLSLNGSVAYAREFPEAFSRAVSMPQYHTEIPLTHALPTLTTGGGPSHPGGTGGTGGAGGCHREEKGVVETHPLSNTASAVHPDGNHPESLPRGTTYGTSATFQRAATGTSGKYEEEMKTTDDHPEHFPNAVGHGTSAAFQQRAAVIAGDTDGGGNGGYDDGGYPIEYGNGDK